MPEALFLNLLEFILHYFLSIIANFNHKGISSNLASKQYFALELTRAYVVNSQLWPRAFGLGTGPVPALLNILFYSEVLWSLIHTFKWLELSVITIFCIFVKTRFY